jgi:hypothetical protein
MKAVFSRGVCACCSSMARAEGRPADSPSVHDPSARAREGAHRCARRHRPRRGPSRPDVEDGPYAAECHPQRAQCQEPAAANRILGRASTDAPTALCAPRRLRRSLHAHRHSNQARASIAAVFACAAPFPSCALTPEPRGESRAPCVFADLPIGNRAPIMFEQRERVLGHMDAHQHGLVQTWGTISEQLTMV